MTHIMRRLNRVGSKAHDKDIVEGVTIIETPPMIVVGLVGYTQTPAGSRSICTVWASHTDDSFKRRFYKNWTRSKKRAFANYQQLWSDAKSGEEPPEIRRRLNFIKKYADVVRVVAHSQVKKLKNLGLKKAHVMEIQVNGGSIKDKVDFGYKLFEKPLSVKTVFHENECIDTIAVTKGHGTKGVINRWGTRRLPRKTHRGLRKVACVGAWHPPRMRYTVARAGQKGYHHRTEIHKKIYRIGDAIEYGEDGKPTTFNASTEFDLTKKTITPMGGFVRYGVVKQEFIMIKGTCAGVCKRPITLRKAIVTPSSSIAKEEIQLKFIDTTSQYGAGRFQTVEEKREWFGPTKKERLAEKKSKRAKDASKEDDANKFKSKSQQKKAKGSKKKASAKKGSKKKTETEKIETKQKSEAK